MASADAPTPSTAEVAAAIPEGTLVGDAIRLAARIFADAGVDSATHDARLLMAYALVSDERAGDQRAEVGAGQELPLSPAPQGDVFMASDQPAPAVFAEWVARRACREPLQHVVGATSFYGLDFFSQPGAFIPRPETELLVEWAVEQVEQSYLTQTGSDLARSLFTGRIDVIDLCCGPGTILLAIAHACTALFEKQTESHLRELRLVGVELSSDAVELARRNMTALRAQGLISPKASIEFIQADVTDREWIVDHELATTTDVIVSNPPYVPESAIAEGIISPEVLADPHEAVFSGADGMEIMAPLAATMDLLAAPRSSVAIEHDDANGAKVRMVLESIGAVDVTQHEDFTGRDRFVSAAIRRPATYIPPRPDTL